MLYQSEFIKAAVPKGISVTNIISFKDKCIVKNEKTSDRIKERKILAVQKVFQCVRCAFKCEKCGANLETDPKPVSELSDGFHIPYNFCDGCREDYVAYIHFLKGKQDPLDYWRNEEWAMLWRKWMDYQAAMDGYLKSKEFKKLLLECRGSCPSHEEV